MLKRILPVLVLMLLGPLSLNASKSLHELQQEFVDLKFGLFVHFGMGTYHGEDWADPDKPILDFNPQKLDCRQWVDAAREANMNFGCMSVKHHCGFCMWNTATTDYNACKSGAGRDVVKEFTDALREKGMKVMFHFSILDMHEKILPNNIKPYHTDFIKAQLRELLTNYGPVTALMIDGWDAPWSRLSYEDISFEDIYNFCKSIQPECLVMDLNGAKYPSEALFYSDLKTYEQGAGQKIEKDRSFLPSMACYPLQRTWFWKEDMPQSATKSPEEMVNDNLKPMNDACCTFILNVAPNRDGLFDRNAVDALRQIGKLWKGDGKQHAVAETGAPIISTNLAKHKATIGSWSYDMNQHDLATDDNFSSSWVAHPSVKEPWIQVELGDVYPVNAVVLTDRDDNAIKAYKIECRNNGEWITVYQGPAITDKRVKITRFESTLADAVKMTVTDAQGNVQIRELGVYNEKR